MLSTDTNSIGQSSAQSPQDAVDGDSNDVGPDREQLVFPREFFAEANPSTAHDIVRRVPGFQIDEGEALRGFSVAVGNVLINGARPVSKSETLTDLLQRIPAERVARIELIRGSRAGVDTGGHRVIANVVLDQAAFRQHAVDGEALLFEGGPNLIGGNYDFTSLRDGREWAVRIGRGFTHTDSTGHGRSVRYDADGEVLLDERLTSSFDSDGWHGRADWAGPVAGGALRLGGGVRNREFRMDQSLVADDSERRFVSDSETDAGDLAVRFDRALAEGVWMQARLLQDLEQSTAVNLEDSPDQQARFDSDIERGETIARGVLRWQAGEDWSLESSGEFAYNFLDAAQGYVENGQEIELPQANTRVEESRGEAAVRLDWQPTGRLALEAGLAAEYSEIRQRGDASAARSFFYFKPHLTASFEPVSSQSLQFRFERELGQLDFTDFAASTALADGSVQGGNLDLRPQQRWIVELSWEYRFAGDGVLTVTGRRDRIVDAIDRIPLDDGLSAVGNIGDANLKRLAVNLRVPLDGVGIPGAFATVEGRYDHTRVTDPTTGRSRELTGVRPFEGAVRFEQDVPGHDVSWGVTWLPYYRHPTYEPDQQRYFRLKNYFIAFAQWQVDETLSIRVQGTVWDNFEQGRDVYRDRQGRDIAFIERQYTDPREFLTLNLRKTF